MTVLRFGCILPVGALTAMIWYLPNWRNVSTFALSAAYGKISLSYGNADVLSSRVLLDYLVGLSSDALSTGYAFLLVIAAAAWLLLPRGRRNPNWLLVTWPIVPFVVVTFAVAKDLRYLAPAVPVAALWLSRTITVFCPPRRLVAASGLLLGVPLFAYACSSFPIARRIPGFAIGRFQVWSSHLAWFATAPGDAGSWQQSAIVSTICDGPEPPQRGDRLLLLVSQKYP